MISRKILLEQSDCYPCLKTLIKGSVSSEDYRV